MTERKPPDLSFTSWIDRQINEAAQRGAFDHLPGAGKPLPKRTEADAAQAWLRDYLRREGVSAEEILPTPLKLRKEIERLAETVQELRSEQEVRAVVADLNRRIIEWRRIPTGPPVLLPLLDAESLVGRWHDAHPDPPPPSPAPAPAPPTRRWRRLRPLRLRGAVRNIQARPPRPGAAAHRTAPPAAGPRRRVSRWLVRGRSSRWCLGCRR